MLFHQPIWNICERQIGSFPQVAKIIQLFELPPPRKPHFLLPIPLWKVRKISPRYRPFRQQHLGWSLSAWRECHRLVQQRWWDVGDQLERGRIFCFENMGLFNLVGGWTNPFEKYARQLGNLPQIGVKIKHIWNHQPVMYWIHIGTCLGFNQQMWALFLGGYHSKTKCHDLIS